MKASGKMITVMLGMAAALVVGAGAANAQGQTSRPFTGAKVNAGTVTHTMQDGKHVLTLSADFQVPDMPIRTGRSSTARGVCSWLQRLKRSSLFAVAAATE